MSTKSSVFFKELREGGEVHCYYEMNDSSYWLSIRIPFVCDMLVPMPFEETAELEKRIHAALQA